MKRVVFALAQLLIISVLSTFAQEYKWGFIDKTGKWVIPPQFDYAEDFSEGLAAVELNKKIGYVDVAGIMVIPPQFKKTESMSFHEGLAAVEVEGEYGKWGWGIGYIDRKGTYVIPLRSDYAFAGEFHEGLAYIGDDFSTGEYYGFVDHSGKMVIPARFWRAGDFSEGLAVAHAEELGRKGYIDKTGSWVINPQFDEAWDFREGLAPVAIMGTWGYTWGYIDKTGNMVISPQFDLARNFSEGLAVVSYEVSTSYKSGYIDKAGNMVISCIFDSAEDFSEGLAAISTEGKWGYINKSGDLVIRTVFDNVKKYSESLAAVSINHSWGYIDKSGWEKIPFQFVDANPFHEGLAAVKVDFEQYRPNLIAYEKATATVQKMWNEYNKKLLEYPYNTEKQQLAPLSMTSFFMNPRLSFITDSIIADLDKRTTELMANCYLQLKFDNPDVFAKIYLQFHPEAKSVLDNLKQECRCNNYSEEQLVQWIADNNIPECTCRNDYWNQYGSLFSTRAEFDNTYNISEQGFLDDVNLRQRLKADIQEITSMLAGLKSAKFKDGLTGKKEDIVHILQRVQYHKGKYYYDEVLEMMFIADVAMMKEWEKNGQLFSSKNEFYEAYVSGDYKNVLKEKKK